MFVTLHGMTHCDMQVWHEDDQGFAAWWAATVVGNNRDAFLFNEEEPEPLWRVAYDDGGNGIWHEDRITQDDLPSLS